MFFFFNFVNNSFENCTNNKKFEIVEIFPNLIIIKNANEIKLTNDCNNIEYKLNKNNLVTYKNCAISINNV